MGVRAAMGSGVTMDDATSEHTSMFFCAEEDTDSSFPPPQKVDISIYFRHSTLDSRILFIIQFIHREHADEQALARLPLLRVCLCERRRFAPGNAPEYRARHETGSARVVEVKKPAHEFAGGIKAGQRFVADVENVGCRVNLEPAEGKGNPTTHLIN